MKARLEDLSLSISALYSLHLLPFLIFRSKLAFPGKVIIVEHGK
jgi:hypothetical protein